jgi:hypothetical protein
MRRSRLDRTIRNSTGNPAATIAIVAGAAGLALGVARLVMRARGRLPAEDTLPVRDELESEGPGIISESEDFTTPGTVEIEVTRTVTASADSAEGAAHVPGGSAPRGRRKRSSRHRSA